MRAGFYDSAFLFDTSRQSLHSIISGTCYLVTLVPAPLCDCSGSNDWNGGADDGLSSMSQHRIIADLAAQLSLISSINGAKVRDRTLALSLIEILAIDFCARDLATDKH